VCAVALVACGSGGGPDIGKLKKRAASGDSQAFDQLLEILDKEDPESTSYERAKIAVDDSAIKHLNVLKDAVWKHVGETAERRFDLLASKSPRGESRARVLAKIYFEHDDKKVKSMASEEILTMNGLEAWTVGRVAADGDRLDKTVVDCLDRLTTLGDELQGTPVTAVIDASVRLLANSKKGEPVRAQVARIIGHFGDRAHVEGAYGHMDAVERRELVGQLAMARNLSHLQNLVEAPKLSAVQKLHGTLHTLVASAVKKDAGAARKALQKSEKELWALQLGYKVHLCFDGDKKLGNARAIAGRLNSVAKFTVAQLLELLPDEKDVLARIELDALVLAKAVEKPATCS
jgi:hypothetical protein